MTFRAIAASIGLIMLAACGGGGSGGTAGDQSTPTLPGYPETLRGAQLWQNNASNLSWYASPNVDLPRHGLDGLHVERPQGGAAVPRFNFSPLLRTRLEPGWRFDADARARIDAAGLWLWRLANQAYLQWTRHLNYDPGSLAVHVGAQGSLACHSGQVACYVPNVDAVILGDEWIAKNYENLMRAVVTENRDAARRVGEELFYVLAHEAAHQFGYMNPTGTTDGCGGGPRCHAPYGSGSVASYDASIGRSVRYHVTEEDIRHIPNATWNDDTVDRYTVMKTSASSSIDSWGIWIDHTFKVDGQTAPGRFSGGNLSIVDDIAGTGWIQGRPSENVVLTSSATWSGEDNFLGVDLGSDYLGALLRADANLRYTFGSHPSLILAVNNFEAHYAVDGAATWHDHSFQNWGDFTYNMDCTSGGCSGDSVDTKWYPSDAGDPSGLIGGVVSDQDNAYVGSFVAEKD